MCVNNTSLPLCTYVVSHKQRTCKFRVVPGRSFCGIHLDAVTSLEPGSKRIPCPLDAKQCATSTAYCSLKSLLHHLCLFADTWECLCSTVLESELKAHLEKCPAKKKQAQTQVRVPTLSAKRFSTLKPCCTLCNFKMTAGPAVLQEGLQRREGSRCLPLTGLSQRPWPASLRPYTP